LIRSRRFPRLSIRLRSLDSTRMVSRQTYTIVVVKHHRGQARFGQRRSQQPASSKANITLGVLFASTRRDQQKALFVTISVTSVSAVSRRTRQNVRPRQKQLLCTEPLCETSTCELVCDGLHGTSDESTTSIKARRSPFYLLIASPHTLLAMSSHLFSL